MIFSRTMPDILTLTMNPCVDISTSTQRVEPTHKVRCSAPQRHPGGGGVNVARVVHRLGGDCAALYPAGGVNGEVLQSLLEEEGVAGMCVAIGGETRESFSVRELSSALEYRFVLPGPQLAAQEWQACLDRIAALEPAPRYLVASGSLPPGVPIDFYARLIRLLRPSGTRVVLDSSGAPLAAALEEGVYLVKPSLHELCGLVGQPLETEGQWRAAAAQLRERGRAQVVVLTLGAGGALLVSAEGSSFAPALPVQVVSAIGAGDSFVGAMVWALARGLDVREAFRYGVAAGSAALLAEGTGLAQAADLARLHEAVTVIG